jgi:hypothetical protein
MIESTNETETSAEGQDTVLTAQDVTDTPQDGVELTEDTSEGEVAATVAAEDLSDRPNPQIDEEGSNSEITATELIMQNHPNQPDHGLVIDPNTGQLVTYGDLRSQNS